MGPREMFVNFWDQLGVDEGGMPTHLPMGVTENDEGPENHAEAHHYRCWCNDPQCPLTSALRQASDAGLRRGLRHGL